MSCTWISRSPARACCMTCSSGRASRSAAITCRTLMGKMGIAAVYRKRKTSVPHAAHPIYPYLLKSLVVDRPNRAWATDLTYNPDEARIRLPGGHHGLGHAPGSGSPRIDQHDQRLLPRSPGGSACQVRRARDLQHRQGSQFTSQEFTEVLRAHDIKISTDSKGRWVDNVFVERLWKSVKYEHVYLHAYESVDEARRQLTGCFTFYNSGRPHSSLGGMTPDTAYFSTLDNTERSMTLHQTTNFERWITAGTSLKKPQNLS
jgi:putative transposase